MNVKYKITKSWIEFIDDMTVLDNDSDSLGELFMNNILMLLGSLFVLIVSILMFIPFNISLLCEFIYSKYVNNFSKNKVLKIIDDYYKPIPSNRYYYLKGYNHSNETLNTFIYSFIINYKDCYNTYEVGTNEFICATDKRRSAHDIYLICRNYYPDITIHDVLKILVNFRNSNKIRVSYCTTICKYVFHVSSTHRDDNDQTEYENGIKFKDLINAYKE